MLGKFLIIALVTLVLVDKSTTRFPGQFGSFRFPTIRSFTSKPPTDTSPPPSNPPPSPGRSLSSSEQNQTRRTPSLTKAASKPTTTSSSSSYSDNWPTQGGRTEIPVQYISSRPNPPSSLSSYDRPFERSNSRRSWATASPPRSSTTEMQVALPSIVGGGNNLELNGSSLAGSDMENALKRIIDLDGDFVKQQLSPSSFESPKQTSRNWQNNPAGNNSSGLAAMRNKFSNLFSFNKSNAPEPQVNRTPSRTWSNAEPSPEPEMNRAPSRTWSNVESSRQPENSSTTWRRAAPERQTPVLNHRNSRNEEDEITPDTPQGPLPSAPAQISTGGLPKTITKQIPGYGNVSIKISGSLNDEKLRDLVDQTDTFLNTVLASINSKTSLVSDRI